MKMAKSAIILYTLLLYCGGAGKAKAQSIFDSSVLHEIRIRFTETNWYDTLAQYYNNAAAGAPKQFLPVAIQVDGNTLAYQSGIRFKGEYSYTGFPGKKKPFRIHFNKIKSAQDYQGIKKINLHNLAGDPSFMREYVSYGLLRSAGIPASRTAFAKLYINDIYWGCYLVVEEPEDKKFLKDNFSASSGNLFEAASTTRLAWNGPAAGNYPELKLQTDENDSAWNNLLQWIGLFNNNFSYDFQQQLYKLFNVDQYFRVLATDIFLNNWDSYAGNGRNFFIYDDKVSGKLQWVPWDYNLAMWKNNLALFPKDANSGYDHKPLVWRIKNNLQLRQQYEAAFCALLNKEFKNYPVNELTRAAVDLVKQAVEEDSLKFYSNDDFYTNRTQAVVVSMLREGVQKNVTLPGITALFADRLAGLRKELNENGCDCDKTTKDNFTSLPVVVFPNPVSHTLLFLYVEQHPAIPLPATVDIINMAGQKIRSFTSVPVAGKMQVDIAALQAGIYYLRISCDGKQTMKKIVRQ